jgi:hypothetical protein
MTNVELLAFCRQNPEPFFDPHYSKQSKDLIISRDPQSPNRLQQAHSAIVRNITAIAALDGKGEVRAMEKLVAEIVRELEVEGINNSEFTSYWEVNDVSFSIYRHLQPEDRVRFVMEMARNYIADRHAVYSVYGYTDTTLQVKADSFAHKRSGGQGLEKVCTLFRRAGLVPEDWSLDTFTWESATRTRGRMSW